MSRAYRQQLTLQRQTRAKDAAGGYTDTWADVVTRRCSMKDTNGTESWARSGQFADVTLVVEMHRDELTKTARPFDRFVDRSTSPETVIEIIGITALDNRGRKLNFLCKRDG